MSAPQWLATALAEHDYAVNDFGSAARRDAKYLHAGALDPGWHGCRCGKWSGYWCDFRSHVAAVMWAEFKERAQQDVERLCEIMHDAYEDAAAREGWETQERSRKPWADVPEANKATMRAAITALLRAMGGDA